MGRGATFTVTAWHAPLVRTVINNHQLMSISYELFIPRSTAVLWRPVFHPGVSISKLWVGRLCSRLDQRPRRLAVWLLQLTTFVDVIAVHRRQHHVILWRQHVRYDVTVPRLSCLRARQTLDMRSLHITKNFMVLDS